MYNKLSLQSKIKMISQTKNYGKEIDLPLRSESSTFVESCPLFSILLIDPHFKNERKTCWFFFEISIRKWKRKPLEEKISLVNIFSLRVNRIRSNIDLIAKWLLQPNTIFYIYRIFNKNSWTDWYFMFL